MSTETVNWPIAIFTCWQAFPHMRLGQFLHNACHYSDLDLYQVSTEDLIKACKKYKEVFSK